MKKQENPDRVDQDAYDREQDRKERERESIAEMAGEGAEEGTGVQTDEER